MTKDEIMRMARTAGLNPKSLFMEIKLKRFAELVTAKQEQEIQDLKDMVMELMERQDD